MMYKVILVFILFLPITALAQNLEREAYDQVVANAKKCSEGVISGQKRINCWVKAAPEKCENIVLDMFHDRMNRLKHRKKLYSCVATCVDAGFLSRKFGQCSTSL
ncbi:MAG: hypothetical protein ACRCVP_12305 [Shewanella xiamenensis]